jgi:hypothetical protein
MFRHVLTGSYHNYFRIFDVDSMGDVVLQADKSAFKAKKIGGPLPGNKLGAKNGVRGLRDAMQMETLDFNKKILHASWHPRENTIAVRSVSSSCCGWTMDIHLCRLDRCNEQPVLIQRRVVFVTAPASRLFSCVIVICRQPFSCRRVVVCSFPPILRYTPRSPLFISLTLSTLYITTIAHSSFARSRSSSLFLLTSHTPLLSHLPRQFSVPDPSISLIPFHSSLAPPPHPRVRISQCRVFQLVRQEVRKRRRITIRSPIFLETPVRSREHGAVGIAEVMLQCRPIASAGCCDRGKFCGHDQRSIQLFFFSPSHPALSSSMHAVTLQQTASTSSL